MSFKRLIFKFLIWIIMAYNYELRFHLCLRGKTKAIIRISEMRVEVDWMIVRVN